MLIMPRAMVRSVYSMRRVVLYYACRATAPVATQSLFIKSAPMRARESRSLCHDDKHKSHRAIRAIGARERVLKTCSL